MYYNPLSLFCIYIFLNSNLHNFDQQTTTSSWLICPFVLSSLVFEDFLAFWHIKMFLVHLLLRLLQTWSHFSKDPSLCLVDSGIQKPRFDCQLCSLVQSNTASRPNKGLQNTSECQCETLTLVQPNSHIISLLDLFQLPIQESRNQSFIIKGKSSHVFLFSKSSPCSKPQGFPDSSADKRICLQCRRPWFDSCVGRSPGEGMGCPHQYSQASLVAQMVKNQAAMRETWV